MNGILKANGNGLVSAAGGSDFQVPLTFTSPLTNVSNTISMSEHKALFDAHSQSIYGA